MHAKSLVDYVWQVVDCVTYISRSVARVIIKADTWQRKLRKNCHKNRWYYTYISHNSLRKLLYTKINLNAFLILEKYRIWIRSATFMQLGFMYTYHKEIKMSKNIIMDFIKKIKTWANALSTCLFLQTLFLLNLLKDKTSSYRTWFWHKLPSQIVLTSFSFHFPV